MLTACTQSRKNNPLSSYDSLLQPHFQPDGPGAVALVMRKGEVLYRKAFGMANIELAVRMDSNSLFRIGSITKQFTACAILKLAEQGKLSLNDEITKFIPDYPTHGFHITIENLLTHTSGIKSFTGLKEWTDEVQKKDFTPLAFIRWFRDQPMDFAPGEEFRYNNSGFFILGYIIEKVSGKSYANYLRDEFFILLALRNTLYDSTLRIIPGRTSGYQKTNGKIRNADYISMSQPYAAGAIISNAGDLYKWTKAVMNGKVISKESLQKAQTTFKLNNGKPANYGYGWFLLNVKGFPTIEHGGGINGFTTYCLYIPSTDVFIALLTNFNSGEVADLTVKMALLALNKPYHNKTIKLPVDSLLQYQGVYESKDKDEAIFRIKDSCLYGWIKGSKRLMFSPSAKNVFFVDGSFTSIEFSRNSQNEIDSMFSYDRAAIIHWKKTARALPEEKHTLIPESILQKYVGEYKLNSDFTISIRFHDKKIYAEGAGQSEFEILAKSENEFVNEDGDIQFEFCKNSSGKINKLKLFQNERVMSAEKIK
jgi:CubicO group peptidase (beta-lactamase class C family)